MGKVDYTDFEDYLLDKFIRSNPTILDDDIPDAFDDYLAGLDVDEWLSWGNNYAEVAEKKEEGK